MPSAELAIPPQPLNCWPHLTLLQTLGLPCSASVEGSIGVAEPAEISSRLGWSEADALRLAAAMELGRRLLARPPRRGEPMRGGEDVHRFLAPHLQGMQAECFHALYLDAKGGLLEWQQISVGTLTASLVHPREVFSPAVRLRAAAVVVAHNHPSGDPEPSAEDRATTRRLQRAGRLLGIELLDHVVVAESRYCSFLEKGLL